MNGSSPTLVPYGADQTIYLVVDRLVASGSVDREIEVERSDLETIIDDLMSGQFNDPVRVIAFNTLEHWSEDMWRTSQRRFKFSAISRESLYPSTSRILCGATLAQSGSSRFDWPDPRSRKPRFLLPQQHGVNVSLTIKIEPRIVLVRGKCLYFKCLYLRAVTTSS